MARLSHERSVDVALLILRIVIGAVFIMHGGQKIFVLGHGAVSEMFGNMGVPMPKLTSLINMWLELIAGLLLVAGLFTWIAAVALAVDMLGAILIVHRGESFFLPNGFEFEFTLL